MVLKAESQIEDAARVLHFARPKRTKPQDFSRIPNAIRAVLKKS